MTIGFRILPSPKRADPKLLERLRALPVSNVSDNMQRSQGANLEPMHRSGRMVGTAFTVRTRPGDFVAGDNDGVVAIAAGTWDRTWVDEALKARGCDPA